MGTLYGSSTIADKAYQHDGFSATIDDSFSTPATDQKGFNWDGTDAYSSDRNAAKIYHYSGFSSTIADSLSTSGPRGLGRDGSNLLVAYLGTAKHIRYVGFSLTVDDSYSTGGFSSNPNAIGWTTGIAAGDVISGDVGTSKHFLHDGFSATIQDSHTATSTISSDGIYWESGYTDEHLQSTTDNAADINDRISRHAGFSSTILENVHPSYNGPVGISWESTPDLSASISLALGASASLIGPTELIQEGYRWRDDDGDEAGATWLESQDTDISRAVSTNTRLRVLVDTAAGNPPSLASRLQYRRVTSPESSWKDIGV